MESTKLGRMTRVLLTVIGGQRNKSSFKNDLEKQSVHENAPPTADRRESPIKDPNIVDWDGPEDPENPMNWPLRTKITAIGIVSALAFLSPLGSTTPPPASADITTTFHTTNETIETFVTSVYLLGYVFGPLVVAPLSELYGRAIVYNICNFGFLIWNIASALANNLCALIIFRLLAGLAGSAPMTIGAGTIADMVPLENRGLAMMGWIMGPVLGPTVGPLIAGYLSQAKGWRWLFWLMSILAGAAFSASLLFLQESYPYTILERKVKRLRKETGNPHLRSILDSGKRPKELFRISIVRSVKMLFLLPIVLLLSLYMATIYGYQYLMFTTFPRVFKGQYGFSNSSVGLVYLGIGVGFLVALVFSGLVSDRLVIYLKERNGGIAKPEYRLPPLFVGALLAPIGLFLYGWSAEERLHWIVPIIGSAFLGAASFMIIMPSLAYLVDAYTAYAASATAAAIVSRSLVGALLPLAGNRMYNALGLGWGNSVLGFIAVVFVPVPLIFWKFAPCSNCVSRGITCDLERPAATPPSNAPNSASSTTENSEIIERLHRLENLLVSHRGAEQGQNGQFPDAAASQSQSQFMYTPWAPGPQIQKVDVDVDNDIAWLGSVDIDQIPLSGQVILLLSIFAASTYFWVQNDCAYGLFSTPAVANEQASLWIKAAEDVLDIACRSPKVSMEGVQGAIIIGFVAAHLDGLHRYQMLFAMAVVLARDLGLHRIDHPSNSKMANTAQAEIGRRVWWHLCTSDWAMAARVGSMGEGIYFCHPRQMMTKKPLNINDEDVFDGMSRDERPLSQPTAMSYTMQRIRLAEVSRGIVDRNPLTMAHASGLSHDAIMDIDTELQALINDVPEFFSASESVLLESYGLTRVQARNVAFQGQTIYFLLYSQRCKLHLPYVARNHENPTYYLSREICIKYARLVIQSELWQQNSDTDTETRFKFTELLAGVFSACVVLLMDLCVNPLSSQYEMQRKEVLNAFKVLGEAKSLSEIIAKSVDSLVHILQKYNATPPNPVPTQQPQFATGDGRLQQSEPVAHTGMDLGNPGGYGHSDVPYSGSSVSQSEINDLDLDMMASGQLHKDGDDLSSFWNDLTQNFEQGTEVGNFDWDNIFLELDSSFI
ncbi:hypothetical protein NECHADRAFT_47622 [Paecilomyces variotii No. 5]|uniref:Major facilitator superfamily (MFS) profile domain-containing protein n=1 Tax=Byssochlamys spectabilis (strain No. 5 / NBRC 109023) TaxID=1356009 RepID=V5FWX7_BYSSN|nr:hypothetical protein NECHADRAFT_47622 [Paecilomyces variotii No. 5]